MGGKKNVYVIGDVRCHLGGGRKYCGAFNWKKGCPYSQRNCPQKAEHKCGYIITVRGDVCGDTSHGAAGHNY